MEIDELLLRLLQDFIFRIFFISRMMLKSQPSFAEVISSHSGTDELCIIKKVHTQQQEMVWNGMENGMERKFRYGIWKMPEWNGMEDFKNRMEDNFHTNSILDFVHCIYRKIHTDVG